MSFSSTAEGAIKTKTPNNSKHLQRSLRVKAKSQRRIEMVEAEEQGPAMRALGSLLKLTEVFLWCLSLSLSPNNIRAFVDAL